MKIIPIFLIILFITNATFQSKILLTKKNSKIQSESIVQKLTRELLEERNLGSAEEYEDKGEESGEKICNLDFGTRLFGKLREFPKGGVKADGKIKELCPLMQNSCCSSDEINHTFSELTDTILTGFNRDKGYLEAFIATTKDINEEVIQKFLEDNAGKIDNCFNQSNQKQIKEFFMSFKKKDLQQDIIDYRNMILREAYATICAVCDSNNHKYFSLKDNKFSITIETPGEIYFYFRKMAIYKRLIKLEKLNNLYDCFYGAVIHLDALQTVRKKIPDFIISGTESKIKDSSDVKDYISQYYVPGYSPFFLFGPLDQRLKRILFKEDAEDTIRTATHSFYPFQVEVSGWIRQHMEISYAKNGYTLVGYQLKDNEYFKNLKKNGLEFDYASCSIVKVWIITILLLLF